MATPTREHRLTEPKILLTLLLLAVVTGGTAFLVWRMSGAGDVVRIDDPGAGQPGGTGNSGLRAFGGLFGGRRNAASASNAPGPASVQKPPRRAPSVLYPEKSGAFELGGLRYLVVHDDGAGNLTEQGVAVRPAPGYPRRGGSGWEMVGQFQAQAGSFDYQQTLKRVDGRTVSFQAAARSEAGIQTKSLALWVGLPVGWYADRAILVDGSPVQLKGPIRPNGEETFLSSRSASRLEIPGPDGRTVIEGPMVLTMQDNRGHGAGSYTVRLGFGPDQGLLKQSSLELKLTYIANGAK
jgi:hypothetical protein